MEYPEPQESVVVEPGKAKKMESNLPNRQSIRKKGWDYTTPGWYFVTCNTREGRALFGVIVNGRMVLSEAGRVAEECWRIATA